MNAFERLVGQSQAVELLTQAIARNRIAPAYLFTGAEGVGRKLAAYGLIECLFHPVGQGERSPAQQQILRQRIEGRNHPDLLWVEPTYMHQGKRLTLAEAIAADVKRRTTALIRLEQIREVGQFLGRSPLEAARSVVVLEHAEQMPEASANALLKTLEEPGQATLILIARSPESLLPTIVSRCQRIPFFRLTAADVAAVLQRAGRSDVLADPQILQLAQGSPGAAIAHWQRLQEIPSEILQPLTQPPRSPREALSLARQIQQALDVDAQAWLIDWLQQQYWQGGAWGRQTVTGLRSLERARDYLRQNVSPRLVWEVTLLELVRG